jgi:hypothetical protein
LTLKYKICLQIVKQPYWLPQGGLAQNEPGLVSLQVNAQSKLADAVRLLNSIQEVAGSNLGRDTNCAKGLRGSLQSFQADAGIIPQLRHDRSLRHPCQCIHWAVHRVRF